MNNNRKTISVCSIIALLVLAVVIIITIINDLIQFSIILGGLFIILTICLAIYLKEAPDEYSVFIKEKKKILHVHILNIQKNIRTKDRCTKHYHLYQGFHPLLNRHTLYQLHFYPIHCKSLGNILD